MRAQFLPQTVRSFRLHAHRRLVEREGENQADTLLAVNATTANGNTNLRNIANQYTVAGGPAFAYDSRFLTGSRFSTFAPFGDPTPLARSFRS